MGNHRFSVGAASALTGWSISAPSLPLHSFSLTVLAFQANTKFNSRWTTDEQLLAVQGGSGPSEVYQEAYRPFTFPGAEGGGVNGSDGHLQSATLFDPRSDS